jgi:hypothetical protein
LHTNCDSVRAGENGRFGVADRGEERLPPETGKFTPSRPHQPGFHQIGDVSSITIRDQVDVLGQTTVRHKAA